MVSFGQLETMGGAAAGGRRAGVVGSFGHLHSAAPRQGQGRHATKAEYFIGIIDILQQYSSRKMAETWFKKSIMSAENASGISALSPEPYAKRFVKFLDNNSR
jgi:hypothetical protein